MNLPNNPEHKFLVSWFFDVRDGNPNGDPDREGSPRVDPLTHQGLVTGTCLKHKLRQEVVAQGLAVDNNKIYLEGQSGALDTKHIEAFTALEVPVVSKPAPEQSTALVSWMLSRYWDSRVFGALMIGNASPGGARGAILVSRARSIDRIRVIDMAITRCAISKEEELLSVANPGGKTNEMGRSSIVPYGLYRCNIYYMPGIGIKNGVSSNDLDIFWSSLLHIWENDRSVMRGEMATQSMYVFEHDSPLGHGNDVDYFKRVTATKLCGGEPTGINDYEIKCDWSNPVDGVTLHEPV